MIHIEHLETNITTACQNHCVGCNHFIPIQEKWMVDPERVKADLLELGKVAHVSKYAIIGGEPALHKKLVDILKAVQSTRTVDYIELWTNGQAFDRLPDEAFKYIDEVVLSVYPGKLTAKEVQNIRSKCMRLGLVFQVKDVSDQAYFTRLMHPDINEVRGSVLYENCWYRGYCHVLDDGYLYRCCISPFMPAVMGLPKEIDGMNIYGATEQDITDFLNKKEQDHSCMKCAGHNSQFIEWREATRETWLEESEA